MSGAAVRTGHSSGKHVPLEVIVHLAFRRKRPSLLDGPASIRGRMFIVRPSSRGGNVGDRAMHFDSAPLLVVRGRAARASFGDGGVLLKAA